MTDTQPISAAQLRDLADRMMVDIRHPPTRTEWIAHSVDALRSAASQIDAQQVRVAALTEALNGVCRIYNDGLDTDYNIATQMRSCAMQALQDASHGK